MSTVVLQHHRHSGHWSHGCCAKYRFPPSTAKLCCAGARDEPHPWAGSVPRSRPFTGTGYWIYAPMGQQSHLARIPYCPSAKPAFYYPIRNQCFAILDKILIILIFNWILFYSDNLVMVFNSISNFNYDFLCFFFVWSNQLNSIAPSFSALHNNIKYRNAVFPRYAKFVNQFIISKLYKHNSLLLGFTIE